MKKVYLIHGLGGNSNENWFEWLKKELLKKDYDVKAFDMPDTYNPKIEQWINFLECEINPEEIDEETYFVGHSIGCQTILRYLEKLHKHKKIAGCVFVAGWFNLINLEPKEFQIAHPWIKSKINHNRVRDHTDNFLAIFSNDDPYIPFEEQEKFKKELGAKVKIKHNEGHFKSTEKIPEILDFLK